MPASLVRSESYNVLVIVGAYFQDRSRGGEQKDKGGKPKSALASEGQEGVKSSASGLKILSQSCVSSSTGEWGSTGKW